MRVLVTGASGLLGSAVSDALLARGDEVVGLSGDPERARSSNPTAIWHKWDAALERPPAEAFDEVEAVVNLIGEPINQRLTDDAKRRIKESRVTATHNLVQAIGGLAEDRRPRFLWSQSAVGYYGDRGDAIVDESTGPGSDFLAGVCVEWEAAAGEAVGLGLRLVVFRTGLPLTPRGGFLKQLLGPFKLGLGGPLAGGRQYMAWIHVEDWVRMVLWALDHGDAAGTFNATAPDPVTNREFSKTLGKVLGRPAIIPAPKLAVRLPYGGELADAVTASIRAVPRRARDAGFEFTREQLEPALRDLL
jgi:uncharacterized protein